MNETNSAINTSNYHCIVMPNMKTFIKKKIQVIIRMKDISYHQGGCCKLHTTF